MDESLLVMENINKSFPGVKALDDAQFELKRGEVHALIGENGAGKTTLMKILTGVYHRDDGEIMFEGKPISVHTPLEAQHLGISIIYQEFNLFPHLTVAENLFIGREPKKFFGYVLDEKKQEAMTREMLNKVDLVIDPKRKVSTLSVAEQQMLEIVKALTFDSKIMIMDEPTAALTDSESDRLFNVIKDLRSQGVGIVYISHRLEELKTIADRVTVMRDGRYIDTVNYRDSTIKELVSMMVGREMTEYYPERSASPKEVMLQVKNLNRKGVLKDISFELYRGEILGVAGLMGAGRTETARAIFGADPKDSGEITLEGKQLTIHSPKDAIRHGIGYLTEDRKKDGLTLGLSVSENIILASITDFRGKSGFMKDDRIKETAEESVSKLRIKTPGINQIVRFLSGGNQQKVVLAKWLCKQSQVLIFDEPTRGIDVGAKREIYELMNDLTSSGNAVLMISSELPEILGMSDRILVMHDGEIAGILDRKDATEEKIMYLATGGK